MVSQLTERFYPITLGLFRIMVGFLFWQHGIRKFGFLEGRVQNFPDLSWFAGVLEAFGGPLISFGLFTRPVAFLLSGQMATAFFLAHLPRGFWPILNGGEPAVFFCFAYLLLLTAGPGRFSLDGWIARKSAPRWWM